MQLLFSDRVKLLGLLQVELELFALTVTLALLIFLPVFDAFLVPFLHKARISLELIDLNSAHFLLPHGRHLLVFSIATSCKICLSVGLFVELLQVCLNIELLLRLIERVNARLKELVLDTVVFFL